LKYGVLELVFCYTNMPQARIYIWGVGGGATARRRGCDLICRKEAGQNAIIDHSFGIDLMRATLIALALICSCETAHAQAWDSRYPVCMVIYGPFAHNDCRYMTLEQCRPLASGRAAQCVENPFFAGPEDGSKRRLRRPHGH
jgi:hypothetical protein